MLAPLRTLAKDLLQHTVLRGAFLWRLPADSRAAALTFDDGPPPQFTPAVLDFLAAHGLKASFFMIGELVTRYPELG